MDIKNFAPNIKHSLIISVLLNLAFVCHWSFNFFKSQDLELHDKCIINGGNKEYCDVVVRVARRNEEYWDNRKKALDDVDSKARKIPGNANKFEFLKKSGYSTDLLQEWMNNTRKEAIQAGFSESEMNEYFYGKLNKGSKKTAPTD